MSIGTEIYETEDMFYMDDQLKQNTNLTNAAFCVTLISHKTHQSSKIKFIRIFACGDLTVCKYSVL
jgi:hypothetical protein